MVFETKKKTHVGFSRREIGSRALQTIYLREEDPTSRGPWRRFSCICTLVSRQSIATAQVYVQSATSARVIYGEGVRSSVLVTVDTNVAESALKKEAIR